MYKLRLDIKGELEADLPFTYSQMCVSRQPKLHKMRFLVIVAFALAFGMYYRINKYLKINFQKQIN